MISPFLSARLAAHGLDRTRFSSPRDVVRHFGCMQAQDIGQAAWNIAARLDGATHADVRRALTRGEIVRTWPMRGTLHFVDPRKAKWLLSLCASKTLPGFARRRAYLGISDADAEKAIAVMKKHLRGGRAISREELGKLLLKSGIPMKGPWVYHLACYAATRGVICFGPQSDEGDTFMLFDEWIKDCEELSRDEQLAELARMYLRGHGPATADDLAWWSGLGKGDCRRAFELVRGECERFEDSAPRAVYMRLQSAAAKTGATRSAPSVRLIGGFDEYFLGYRDRSRVADVARHRELFSVNGIFFPLVLQDGVVAAVWKRTFKKDKVVFSFKTFPRRALSETTLAPELARYARFGGYRKYSVA